MNTIGLNLIWHVIFFCEQICSLRFSTKANCWRHLLKKHANETVGPIESYMFVNSRSRLEESPDISIVDDEAGNCSKLLNMKVKEEVTLTLPGETFGVLNLQKNAPNVRYPVLTDDNEDSDEPLDFSLKSQKSGVAVEPRYAGQVEISNPWSSDEPMDLTVKGHCHQNRTSRESETATLRHVEALPFDLKLLVPRSESKAVKLPTSRHARVPSVLRSCLPFRFGSVSGSFSCAKCHLVFQHEREVRCFVLFCFCSNLFLIRNLDISLVTVFQLCNMYFKVILLYINRDLIFNFFTSTLCFFIFIYVFLCFLNFHLFFVCLFLGALQSFLKSLLFMSFVIFFPSKRYVTPLLFLLVLFCNRNNQLTTLLYSDESKE